MGDRIEIRKHKNWEGRKSRRWQSPIPHNGKDLARYYHSTSAVISASCYLPADSYHFYRPSRHKKSVPSIMGVPRRKYYLKWSHRCGILYNTISAVRGNQVYNTL